MKLPDLKHWNAPIYFLQWIQTNCHHSIHIVCDEKNWIASNMHNHTHTKHHFSLCRLNSSRRSLPQLCVPIIRTWGKWNSSFKFLKCSLCPEINILNFQVTQAPFVCIIFQLLQNWHQWKTKNIFFVLPVRVYHEQNNMIHYGKHETVLFNTCLLYIYLSSDDVYY